VWVAVSRVVTAPIAGGCDDHKRRTKRAGGDMASSVKWLVAFEKIFRFSSLLVFFFSHLALDFTV